MSHAEPWDLPLEIRLMGFITRVLVGVVIGGACVVGALWLLDQPRFDITAVKVQNETNLQRVNAKYIEQVAMGSIDGNFFTLRLDDVKATLETIPWVKKAAVQRVWPYQLGVEIEEHVPLALLEGTLTSATLLGEQGNVFEVPVDDVVRLKLPVLDGPLEQAVASSMWEMYQQVDPIVGVLGVEIEVLTLSEHGIWSMRLVDGTNIIMGRGEAEVLLKRLRAFVQTAPTALRPYEGRVLLRADLRYPSGYALEIAGVRTGEPVAGRRGH